MSTRPRSILRWVRGCWRRRWRNWRTNRRRCRGLNESRHGTIRLMPIESINPANGELLRSFDALSNDALQQKLAVAAEAAKSYRETSLDDRALWMRKLAVLIEQE